MFIITKTITTKLLNNLIDILKQVTINKKYKTN